MLPSGTFKSRISHNVDRMFSLFPYPAPACSLLASGLCVLWPEESTEKNRLDEHRLQLPLSLLNIKCYLVRGILVHYFYMHEYKLLKIRAGSNLRDPLLPDYSHLRGPWCRTLPQSRSPVPAVPDTDWPWSQLESELVGGAREAILEPLCSLRNAPRVSCTVHPCCKNRPSFSEALSYFITASR